MTFFIQSQKSLTFLQKSGLPLTSPLPPLISFLIQAPKNHQELAQFSFSEVKNQKKIQVKYDVHTFCPEIPFNYSPFVTLEEKEQLEEYLKGLKEKEKKVWEKIKEEEMEGDCGRKEERVEFVGNKVIEEENNEDINKPNCKIFNKNSSECKLSSPSKNKKQQKPKQNKKTSKPKINKKFNPKAPRNIGKFSPDINKLIFYLQKRDKKSMIFAQEPEPKTKYCSLCHKTFSNYQIHIKSLNHLGSMDKKIDIYNSINMCFINIGISEGSITVEEKGKIYSKNEIKKKNLIKNEAGKRVYAKNFYREKEKKERKEAKEMKNMKNVRDIGAKNDISLRSTTIEEDNFRFEKVKGKAKGDIDIAMGEGTIKTNKSILVYHSILPQKDKMKEILHDPKKKK